MKHVFGKIFAAALILFLLALGMLGMLVPIIPGLLFLLLAALLAARHFPALESFLGRHRYSAECMRLSNGFLAMDARDKLRLCFWGTLKYTLRGAECLWRFLETRLRKFLPT